MLKKLLLVVALLFVTGCSRVSDETLKKAHEAVNNGAMIVDVRTKEEYVGGHVNEAINIPIKILKAKSKTLDKNRTIVVYCASGSRSAHAAKFLRESGFNVFNVATQSDWQRELK